MYFPQKDKVTNIMLKLGETSCVFAWLVDSLLPLIPLDQTRPQKGSASQPAVGLKESVKQTARNFRGTVVHKTAPFSLYSNSTLLESSMNFSHQWRMQKREFKCVVV